MCFPMICLQWPVAFPFPIFPGILMLAVQFLQPLEPLEPRRSRSLSRRPGAVFEAIGAESNASDAAASFSGFGKALDWMRIGWELDEDWADQRFCEHEFNWLEHLSFFLVSFLPIQPRVMIPVDPNIRWNRLKPPTRFQCQPHNSTPRPVAILVQYQPGGVHSFLLSAHNRSLRPGMSAITWTAQTQLRPFQLSGVCLPSSSRNSARQSQLEHTTHVITQL